MRATDKFFLIMIVMVLGFAVMFIYFSLAKPNYSAYFTNIGANLSSDDNEGRFYSSEEQQTASDRYVAPDTSQIDAARFYAPEDSVIDSNRTYAGAKTEITYVYGGSTGGGLDTNWQTSWSVFDANMKGTYRKYTVDLNTSKNINADGNLRIFGEVKFDKNILYSGMYKTNGGFCASSLCNDLPKIGGTLGFKSDAGMIIPNGGLSIGTATAQATGNLNVDKNAYVHDNLFVDDNISWWHGQIYGKMWGGENYVVYGAEDQTYGHFYGLRVGGDTCLSSYNSDAWGDMCIGEEFGLTFDRIDSHFEFNDTEVKLNAPAGYTDPSTVTIGGGWDLNVTGKVVIGKDWGGSNGDIIFGANSGTSCATVCSTHNYVCSKAWQADGGGSGACSLTSEDYYCWCY